MLNSLAPSAVFCRVIFTFFVFIKIFIDFLHQIKIKWNNYIRFFACVFVLMTPNIKRAPSAVSFSFGNCYIFTSTKCLWLS